MVLLYNIGIFLYRVLIRAAALFNSKAKFMVAGRKNWRNQLEANIEKDAKYLWFHCASLGEFEQGRPLIEETKEQFPEYKVILTFFSPSGYEIRKNYEGADVICYLPMDTKSNAKAFVDIVKPEKVFFVKYEFWYHFITELKSREIPLYIVSAIFRENQQFFKNTFWGLWYRKVLSSFEHFFIQNKKSAELLKSIGIENFTISGDTRFDRVATIAKSAKQFDIVEKFKGNSQLLVAGSTWKPDEDLLIEVINKQKDVDKVKFVIAPHEVSPSNISRIKQLLKKSAISFSKIDNSPIENYDVLIIDSIGILSSLYQYGNLAYIGGGFGVGIHNILEAATFGLPIIFGPNYTKFKEAVDLVDEKGAFSIHNFNDLEAALSLQLNDKNELEKASEISKKYVEKNVGSTKLIIKKVFNRLG